MDFNKLKNRYGSLKAYRDLYIPLWQDISENLNPTSGFFDKDKGKKKRTIDFVSFLL